MEQGAGPEHEKRRQHERRARAVVHELRRNGPTAKGALARTMGVSDRTLDKTLDFLRDGEVIVSHRRRLHLHPDLGVLVGVELRHTTAIVAITWFDFHPVNDPSEQAAQREVAIQDPDATLSAIAALISDQLCAHLEPSVIATRLVGIGLTLPGPIQRQRNPEPSERQAAEWDRRVKAGPILPGWDEVDAAARVAVLLKEKHGIRPPRHTKRRFVWLENDASAGALGVHTELRRAGADRDADDLVYVHVGDGVGAGVINKGHLVTGARGFAGEIGHVTVDRAGRMCPACGGRGCLETVASERAIIEGLHHALRGTVHLGGGDGGDASSGLVTLSTILATEHPAVDRALWDAGWTLGTALAALCCVLNPAKVVLAGTAAEYRSPVKAARTDPSDTRPLVAAVSHALAHNLLVQAAEDLEIVTWEDVRGQSQELGPGMLGALALVIDHLGDAYLLDPVGEWIRDPARRKESLDFA